MAPNGDLIQLCWRCRQRPRSGKRFDSGLCEVCTKEIQRKWA